MTEKASIEQLREDLGNMCVFPTSEGAVCKKRVRDALNELATLRAQFATTCTCRFAQANAEAITGLTEDLVKAHAENSDLKRLFDLQNDQLDAAVGPVRKRYEATMEAVKRVMQEHAATEAKLAEVAKERDDFATANAALNGTNAELKVNASFNGISFAIWNRVHEILKRETGYSAPEGAVSNLVEARDNARKRAHDAEAKLVECQRTLETTLTGVRELSNQVENLMLRVEAQRNGTPTT